MNLFPLYLTVKVSITATVIVAIIGLGLALVLAKKDFLQRRQARYEEQSARRRAVIDFLLFIILAFVIGCFIVNLFI